MRVRGKCLDQDEERRKFPDKKVNLLASYISLTYTLIFIITV